MSVLGLFFIPIEIVIILACCKPGESFIIDIHSQRIHTRDHYIYPQIEFESIKEQGVVNVLTHNLWVSFIRYLAEFISNYNTFTLR